MKNNMKVFSVIFAVSLSLASCGGSVSESGTKYTDNTPNAKYSRLLEKYTDNAASANFGCSVSISGDYAIVGAYGENISAGAAYIFHKTGANTWDSGTKISPNLSTQYFGYSVSISGDYAIVGAHAENSAAGAAYIFHRTGANTWDTGTRIAAPTPSASAQFGFSVSVSGDYAIVGARGENSYAGAAYIFHRTGTNSWDAGTRIASLTPSANGYFGHAVSMNGDYAIVGAYGENNVAGAAYIFQRTGTNSWDAGIMIASLTPLANGEFGRAVSLSGDYAIVGARGENGVAGAAYIFHKAGTNSWDTGTRVASLTPSLNAYFGWSVSISGDYAIVGAYGENISAGAAYIFHRTNTNTWENWSRIPAVNSSANAYFGRGAISGDYIIVGANGENNNTGAAYLFY